MCWLLYESYCHGQLLLSCFDLQQSFDFGWHEIIFFVSLKGNILFIFFKIFQYFQIFIYDIFRHFYCNSNIYHMEFYHYIHFYNHDLSVYCLFRIFNNGYKNRALWTMESLHIDEIKHLLNTLKQLNCVWELFTSCKYRV